MCRRPPEAVGFFADVTADALSLPACNDATTAYSVLEAIRFGAARVLDMHMDDLQILVIGHAEREDVDAVALGSDGGRLRASSTRFANDSAEDRAGGARGGRTNCPAVCGTSCIDCLQTFRNAYYHRFLERSRREANVSKSGGRRLSFDHDIPALQPAAASPSAHAAPVNDAEVRLRHLLLAAGFGEGVRGEQVRLDRSLGTTTPDVIYRADGSRFRMRGCASTSTG